MLSAGMPQAGMDMGIVNAAHCVADVYEKIDLELLKHVEDVLLNRSDDATEKMLDYAATLVRSRHHSSCSTFAALDLPVSGPHPCSTFAALDPPFSDPHCIQKGGLQLVTAQHSKHAAC